MIPKPLLKQLFDNDKLSIDMIDDDFFVVYEPIFRGKVYGFANLSYRDGYVELGMLPTVGVSEYEEILEKFALKLMLEPLEKETVCPS